MDENTETQKRRLVDRIRRIASGISVTKIVATRTVKTDRGDYFVGYSGAFDSHQCDYGGMGADVLPSSEEEEEVASQGLSLKDAALARLLLAREVDLGAWENALLGGSISRERYDKMCKKIRQSYNMKFGELLLSSEEEDNTQEGE